MDLQHVNNLKEMNSEENNNKRKVKNNVLDSFSKLSKGDEGQVVKSSVYILKYLSETEDNEIEYILNRLIRGLGGSKIKIRTNFYATLVAILNSVQDIKLDYLFEVINKTLQSSSGNSKGENADIFAGKILACGAIIHSKLFTLLSKEEQEKILVMLYDAGKQRSYLQLEANTFFADILLKIDKDYFDSISYPIIKEDILRPIEEQTLDSIYLLLLSIDKFPTKFTNKFLKKHISCSSIICEKNIHHLSNLLINTISIKSIKHPVYELLLEKIANSSYINNFINELDTNLVKLNYNRHLTAAHILNIIAEKLNDCTVMPELFTKNFMIHTMQYFKNRNSKMKDDLSKYLCKFFQSVVQKLKSDTTKTSTVISVLKKIIFWPGYLKFDIITKTNTVADITNNLNSKGVIKIIQLYKDILLINMDKVENLTEKWLNSDRFYAAGVITKLLRHPSIAEDLEFRQEQIQFIMNLSLFKTEDCPVSLDLSTSLKKTYFSALDQKFVKLEHLCLVLSKIVHSLNHNLQEKTLLQPIDENTQEVWNKTVRMIEKLEKKSKKSELNNVFYTMFLLMGLQLFQHPKLAEDCLNELFNCYERVKKEKKLDNQENEEPLWIEVVIDLFLNLLSQNSHLFRNMIASVFPHLCKHLNTSTIHQILDVLDPNNETNPLKRNDDDEIEDEENEEDTIENDDGSDNEEEEEEESNSESNDDDENLHEDVNDKLRLAIQQVLRPNVDKSDDESVNLDDLSENEGKELDLALSAAFKQFKPNSGKKTKKQPQDEKALTHFRVRVLDLIKIYINTTPSMTVCMEILLPLLRLLEFTIRESHQVPLYVPIKKLIEKMSQLKKFSSIDDVDENTLIDLLKSLLNKGTRNINVMRDMDDVLSNACVFLVRCVQFYNAQDDISKKSKKKLKNSVLEILNEELSNFFTKRDSLTPYVLFKDIFSLNWDLNCNFVPILVNIAFNLEIRLFKRTQCLQLLSIIYSNHRLLNTLPENERQSLVMEFSEKAHEFLQNLCNNPTKSAANDKFLTNIFDCLTLIKKSSNLEDDSMNFAKIGELIRNVRSMNNKKLFTLKSNGKLTEVDEEKVNGNNELLNGDIASIKKHKKKTKESKKDKQMKRLQSLSEGFGDSLSLGDLNGEDYDGEMNETDSNETITSTKRKTMDFTGNLNKKKKKV